jgi:N utilization substance protein B
MGSRREARERAVQFLFQHDLNPPEEAGAALEEFWRSLRAAGQSRTAQDASSAEAADPSAPGADESALRLFADPLIRGTIEHRDEIDARIRQLAHNWELHRMATVDRNVLRLAMYEMLYRPDIPPVVSINEAVDIAKKFSTEDSGRFVNGILDTLRKELQRPARAVA